MLLGMVVFGLASNAAVGQPNAAPGDPNYAVDPPGRVGRLADVEGQAWLLNPETGEWVSAERNQPLTRGDRLSTDRSARVELRVGSTVVRLDGDTELEVLELDDERLHLNLHSGTAAVTLRQPDTATPFEMHTAEGRFVIQRPGHYRFDHLPGDRRGGSQATVWNGELLYEGPGSALTVYTGQRADLWLDGRGAAQYSLTEPVRDAFAAWASDRDRADLDVARSPASRYVSPEMTGVEDLDRYGRWDQDPEYGALWIPRTVAAGWVPYGAGRWTWVRPWGWTWVDDAPWGFAPFHYGRWVMRRNVWCWAPGTYVARPVYAPALVAWVGGPQLSVSISSGNRGPAVGWFPLAPREVYVPNFRSSPRYIREVNVTHVTRIDNITTIINNPQGVVSGYDYRNRRYAPAVTIVPETVFRGRQPIGPRGGMPFPRGPRGPEPWQVQVQAPPVLVAPPVLAPAMPPRAGGPAPWRSRRPDDTFPDPRRGPPPVAAQPAQPVQPIQPGQRPVRPGEEPRGDRGDRGDRGFGRENDNRGVVRGDDRGQIVAPAPQIDERRTRMPPAQRNPEPAARPVDRPAFRGDAANPVPRGDAPIAAPRVETPRMTNEDGSAYRGQGQAPRALMPPPAPAAPAPAPVVQPVAPVARPTPVAAPVAPAAPQAPTRNIERRVNPPAPAAAPATPAPAPAAAPTAPAPRPETRGPGPRERAPDDAPDERRGRGAEQRERRQTQ